jgi:hypothetical protein
MRPSLHHTASAHRHTAALVPRRVVALLRPHVTRAHYAYNADKPTGPIRTAASSSCAGLQHCSMTAAPKAADACQQQQHSQTSAACAMASNILHPESATQRPATQCRWGRDHRQSQPRVQVPAVGAGMTGSTDDSSMAAAAAGCKWPAQVNRSKTTLLRLVAYRPATKPVGAPDKKEPPAQLWSGWSVCRCLLTATALGNGPGGE